jgi:hypothetical protein
MRIILSSILLVGALFLVGCKPCDSDTTCPVSQQQLTQAQAEQPTPVVEDGQNVTEDEYGVNEYGRPRRHHRHHRFFHRRHR